MQSLRHGLASMHALNNVAKEFRIPRGKDDR